MINIGDFLHISQLEPQLDCYNISIVKCSLIIQAFQDGYQIH